MLFNSFEYLAFFLLVLLSSWALIAKPKARIWLLLLGSYYFYVSNNHWLIVLILLSTQIDYQVALAIDASKDPRHRRRATSTSSTRGPTSQRSISSLTHFVTTATMAFVAS